MNAIMLRNLSDKATRALEALADANGITAEMEAERILTDALEAAQALGQNAQKEQEPEVGLGTALRRLREQFPELADIDFARDQAPPKSPSFE